MHHRSKPDLLCQTLRQTPGPHFTPHAAVNQISRARQNQYLEEGKTNKVQVRFFQLRSTDPVPKQYPSELLCENVQITDRRDFPKNRSRWQPFL